ncbi:hypothetical protein F2P81_024433 [Scophthalmus maximus]|uniref:Uncharacterized protein n=1 Tax=Scophthalmus maximus TaxID=52904 RepID=A0A6A4RPG9_SCOMX|nr:hypothetical protein F2P81_024433 [Scophthalmus maximus]
MENINAKYVSQKISKTRWKPVSYSSLQQPDVFATGSWDNENNKISIWSIGNNGSSGTDDGFEGDPQLLCEHKHDGDVLDLQFLDQDRIVTASSTGAVTIFRHHQNSQTISVSQQWARAHRYPCDNAPCTGVVCSSPEIVTVGEDGRIIVFRADQEGVNRVIENADSSTIHAVTFLRTTEILTVNSIGQLKMWDFRQQSNSPSQILSLSGDRVPLHCVDRHPNQQHIVATGGQDGMLCVWDVRQGSTPFSLMEAHSAETCGRSTCHSDIPGIQHDPRPTTSSAAQTSGEQIASSSPEKGRGNVVCRQNGNECRREATDSGQLTKRG